MWGLEVTLPESWHHLILVLHLMVTSVMVGVIWFVQHVHYPLKPYVDKSCFRDYQEQHIARTGHIVALPMLAEAALATMLILAPAIHGKPGLAWLGALLLLGIWMATAVFQVPQHKALTDGFSPQAHRRLTTSNWLRTGMWSARALIAAALLAGG